MGHYRQIAVEKVNSCYNSGDSLCHVLSKNDWSAEEILGVGHVAYFSAWWCNFDRAFRNGISVESWPLSMIAMKADGDAVMPSAMEGSATRNNKLRQNDRPVLSLELGVAGSWWFQNAYFAFESFCETGINQNLSTYTKEG